jgi:hypothetical protein
MKSPPPPPKSFLPRNHQKTNLVTQIMNLRYTRFLCALDRINKTFHKINVL